LVSASGALNASSRTWSTIFRPLIPPWLLTWSNQARAPSLTGLQEAATGPVRGFVVPILIWVSVTPCSDALSAAPLVSPQLDMVNIVRVTTRATREHLFIARLRQRDLILARSRARSDEGETACRPVWPCGCRRRAASVRGHE